MSSPRLQGLQTLRAVAAVMVLIGHVLAEAEHFFALDLPGDVIPWTRGVDLFFVISGFVVALSADRFRGRPGAFLRRRMIRIVPLYFLFTTLMVAILILMPSGLKDTALDPGQIVSSYLFFPYERADGRIAPVLSLGWTLNYEVFFYVVLALCLILPSPLIAVSAIIVGLGGLGLVRDFENPQLVFWTNPLIIEFVFGLLLARLWASGWRRPHMGLAVAGMLGGVGLLVLLDQTALPRFIAAGVPAAMMVASATMLCPVKPLPWQLLGDASYALYLSHRFSLRAATLLFLPMLPSTQSGAALFVLGVCGVAITVGLLTYVLIERPLQRFLTIPAGSRVPV